jgi:hypothetical protein
MEGTTGSALAGAVPMWKEVQHEVASWKTAGVGEGLGEGGATVSNPADERRGWQLTLQRRW